MKFEKMIKKKIEIKTKIAPGKAVSPKTASSSFFRKKITVKNLFNICEFINQYTCGKKKIQIKTENQFIIIFIEKIFTFGSKDENRFIILIKKHFLGF